MNVFALYSQQVLSLMSHIISLMEQTCLSSEALLGDNEPKSSSNTKPVENQNLV